jgi:hypothetical protein
MLAPSPRISCKDVINLIQNDKKLKKVFGNKFSASYLKFVSENKPKPII